MVVAVVVGRGADSECHPFSSLHFLAQFPSLHMVVLVAGGRRSPLLFRGSFSQFPRWFEGSSAALAIFIF